jgi:hypothetical protein
MSKYLNDIKNTKVIKVYELNNNFEIVYEKDDIEKSLSVYHKCSISSMRSGCWFVLSGIALPKKDKTIFNRFSDIDTIVEINNYFQSGYNDGYEDLEIVYKNKSNQISNYLLNTAPDDEDIYRLDIYKNRKSKYQKYKYNDEQFPKELYSTRMYKEILALALKAHKEQKTPDGLPYSFHIVSVANEIVNSLYMNRISYDEANVAIACALLHDVNEDTDEGITQYTLPLGTPNSKTIADGVSALTKDETLGGKQIQMKDSLDRLKQMPYCVQMVKLADRITNLAPAPLFWNKAKRQEYLSEAKKIYEALKDSNQYLANKLKYKIDNYLVAKVLSKFDIEQDDDYIVFYSEDLQLILNKNHKGYLKTFKAINRLNDYIFKAYNIRLFKRKYCDYDWENREKEDITKYTSRVGIEYIIKTLDGKSDAKIDSFISTIKNGRECIII